MAMSHHLTRGLGVALAVSALCSLTACATDEASVPSSSASGSAASIVAPTPPAAMSDSGEAGAVAAAEYFLRLSLYGAATGDWSEYDAMSGEDCSFCTNYQKANEENRQQGIIADSLDMEVFESAAQPWDENPALLRVDLLVRRNAHNETDGQGALTTVEPEDATIVMVMDKSEAWKIQEVQSLEASAYYDVLGHEAGAN